MKGQMKKTNGITLIALVITIIVMLILAGVSISLIAGENGILKRATQAVDTHKQATVVEEAQMAFVDWQMDYITDGVAYEGRYAEIPSGAVVCAGGKMYAIDNTTSKIYEASLPANGELGEFAESTLNKTSQIYKATHPEEQAILKGDSATYEYVTGTWGTGYVIKDKSTNDEFVWIPVVSNSAYAKKSGSRNYHMSAQNVADHGRDVVALDVAGDDYGTNALVTSEATERAAVNAAGGFYVSRYEIGIDNATRDAKQTDANWGTVKSQKGLEPARDISQTKSLEIANAWKTNGVQSGLITGTQWDTMCKFIGWDKCDSDCTTWGNYINVKSKAYADGAMWHSGYQNAAAPAKNGLSNWYNTAVTKDNRDMLSAKDTTERVVFATGSFENENGGTTAQKNIYDVAGNVWEWTTETITRDATHRVLRGGSTDYDGWNDLATYRHGNDTASYTYWHVGFRAVLYVK